MTNRRKRIVISCVALFAITYFLMGTGRGQILRWKGQLNSPLRKSRINALLEIGRVMSQFEWATKYRTGGFFPEKAKAEYERLHPIVNEAVPLVIQALSDDEETVRIRAARALGKIPIQAKKVVPAINRALKEGEPCPRVRQEFIMTLTIYEESALPALSQILRCADDSSRDVRRSVAYALIFVGVKKKETHGAIRKLLLDDDRTTRFSSVKAAAKRKGTASFCVPILKKWLSDEAAITREVGAEYLGVFGTDDREAIEMLKELAKTDTDPEARKAAKLALEEIAAE